MNDNTPIVTLLNELAKLRPTIEQKRLDMENARAEYGKVSNSVASLEQQIAEMRIVNESTPKRAFLLSEQHMHSSDNDTSKLTLLSKLKQIQELAAKAYVELGFNTDEEFLVGKVIDAVNKLMHEQSTHGPDNATHRHDKKKPCPRCKDEKLVAVVDEITEDGRGTTYKKELCSCVSVNDMVSSEVVNMLPVGSIVESTMPHLRRYVWEKVESGWRASDGSFEDTVLFGGDRRILHIGTATKPDKAEQIAKEIEEARNHEHGGITWHDAITMVLRKHNVGKVPTLSEKLADPDLATLVAVVKAAILSFEVNWEGTPVCVSAAVDALSHKLYAAVKAVK